GAAPLALLPRRSPGRSRPGAGRRGVAGVPRLVPRHHAAHVLRLALPAAHVRRARRPRLSLHLRFDHRLARGPDRDAARLTRACPPAPPPWGPGRESHPHFMLKGGSFPARAEQSQRLADEPPERWDYAFALVSCIMREGDSLAPARWYQGAASLPGAPEPIRR